MLKEYLLLEKLDKAYPLPKPVEVIVDHESRDKLILAQRRIIELQEKVAAQAEIVSRVEYQQALIEMKDEELEKAKKDLQEQQNEIFVQNVNAGIKEREISELKEKLEQAEKMLAEEQAKVEQMEKAGLFKRLLKKWT